MLESLFDRQRTVRRLRSGCTGPHTDAFAAELVRLGFAPRRVGDLIYGVGHLGGWLDARDRPLCSLDETALRDFVEEVTSRSAGGGKPRYCRSGGRRFLKWARHRGIVTTASPNSGTPQLIQDFEAWMVRHRDVSPVTLDNYRPPLRRFLDAVGADPGHFDAAGIRRFIVCESEQSGRGTAKLAVSAIRMLLRHLAIRGECAPQLVEAVPSVASWKLASLPKYLSRADVDRIIAACAQTTLAGRRDRAMILLMARLGLRSGDVAGLRCGDVDWGAATVNVSGKGRRPGRMPLPQDVGDAMLLWLAEGRPNSSDDHVFLRVRAPFGPMTKLGMNSVVLRAAKRAGLPIPRVGPHMLRHSVATALLNDGLSLPGVAALLRHSRVDTTTIYAKVDVGLLASIARPWPVEVSR